LKGRQRKDVGLFVIGTRERSAFKKLLLGCGMFCNGSEVSRL